MCGMLHHNHHTATSEDEINGKIVDVYARQATTSKYTTSGLERGRLLSRPQEMLCLPY